MCDICHKFHCLCFATNHKLSMSQSHSSNEDVYIDTELYLEIYSLSKFSIGHWTNIFANESCDLFILPRDKTCDVGLTDNHYKP